MGTPTRLPLSEAEIEAVLAAHMQPHPQADDAGDLVLPLIEHPDPEEGENG